MRKSRKNSGRGNTPGKAKVRAPRVVITMNTGTRTMKSKNAPKGGQRNAQKEFLDEWEIF